jgi:3-methylcrotonyl-CoA carboxylase alpha subunit
MTAMFRKILIANRGEIACRVIATARRMGLRTVAVHSEADRTARHVRLADEAVLIGPAPARDSYLVIDRLLDAARRSGAEAIHPGYGFLSESAAFAEACAAAGIAFIGPPASAIRAMGSKARAKALMEKAGIPLVPGYHGDDQDPDRLQAEADAIGYPVLVKAVDGGGGKGMRVVERAADFADALASCRREAAASFGNDHVLIEKYLSRPRHIEVQVFGDSQGNHVHLFERDCSVQRRHQKVVEEAPAPGMTAERRAAMGQAAVEVARAIGYVGAGTVEFIADTTGRFYFMEMNTRLQVEHPVTEMITGVDLVEWQLRVAAGQPLPLSQEALTITGHALEARIYAEDPDTDFLPSIGTLVHLALPETGPHVRVDSGVEQGDAISPHYDPMIAKLIVWDEDRERAVARMRGALAACQVAGIASNLAFLSRLIACPAFAGADLDTGLIARQRDALFPPPPAPSRTVWLGLAVADLLAEARDARAAARAGGDPTSPWAVRDGWRLNLAPARPLTYHLGEWTETVTLRGGGDTGPFDMELDGVTSRVAGTLDRRGRLRLEVDGVQSVVTVIATGDRRVLFADERVWTASRVDPLHVTVEGSGADEGLLAPMPGRIIALMAAEGDTVDKGAPLVVLEAMKMEHTIRAPGRGTLVKFAFAVGDQVADGAALAVFHPEPAEDIAEP